jgi:hypothetical protein
MIAPRLETEMIAGRRLPLRIVRRFSLLLPLAPVGCSQQPPTEEPASVAVVVRTPEVLPSTAPQPSATPIPETPSGFEFPADLGGQMVAHAVAPDTPALPPIKRFAEAPHPRTPPARLLDPAPVAKPRYALAPFISVQSSSLPPAPPVERVPFDLGRGASAIPARPSLPVAKVETPRSRDVNRPPALPMLGRPVADRVSLDDPTTELAHAAIVEREVKVPLTLAAFLKVGIPDPFELAEQVKSSLPPSAEPGLEPVPVNPRRVK